MIPMWPASRRTCPSAKTEARFSIRQRPDFFYGAVPGRDDRCFCDRGHCARCRLRAVKVAPVDQSGARTLKNNEQKQGQPFHGVDATRSAITCQCPRFFYKSPLHDLDLAGKFTFRQGLWIEDLQTPPGQECSNGSLILLAVVLWRTFFAADAPLQYETAES